MSRALDTRDEETEEHSQRVKRYTGLIATQLGVPDDEREDMLRGALLHDIGKIGVPDAILLKPGRLTPDELAIMRKHPEIGYGMIAHIPFLTDAAQVVLHHHESYDGGGYPSGLAGATIPLGARIFAVADTFDAMTSDRPYRSALPVETAMQELESLQRTAVRSGDRRGVHEHSYRGPAGRAQWPTHVSRLCRIASSNHNSVGRGVAAALRPGRSLI